MFKELNYKSCDKQNTVRAVKWVPEGNPKYILQIAHGMAEHVMRYEHFAKFLCKNGFLVCGEDHLGHGKTAKNPDDFGYCESLDGHKNVVCDMKQLHDIISKEYPNVPYFLLGHSMGSFLCREFIETYGQCLDGAIVMGTGQQPEIALWFAKTLCRLISVFHGWRFRSNAINKLAIGGYNKKFKPIVTGHEWLCRDDRQATRYENDPYCGYVFTLNGFYNMFDLMSYIRKTKNVNKIPKDLPILICSGDMDPVGNYGKAPKAVYNSFKNVGIKDLTLNLYKDDRHEILNELDQSQVYGDILTWLKEHA